MNGSSCLYEVMATAYDEDLEYMDGSSRIRGLGCDGDRLDALVEIAVPVVVVVLPGILAQVEV